MNNIATSDRPAELSLVGSVMFDNSAIYKVAGKIKEEHLFYDDIRTIWRHALMLFSQGKNIDNITLSDSLSRSGELGKVGGDETLWEMARAVPHGKNVEVYAEIIIDRYLKRSLLEKLDESTRLVQSGEGIGSSLVMKTMDLISGVAETTINNRFVDTRSEAAAMRDKIRARMGAPWTLSGISTGFPMLDDKISGLQGSQLYLVAARPGAGKTSFMLNIARSASIDQGVGTGIFSLEMNRESLLEKILVEIARVPNKKVKNGNINHVQMARIEYAAAMIENAAAPIMVDDNLDLTVIQMLASARQMQKSHGIGLVIIDYIQLMSPDKASSRQEEVSKISRGLKAMSRALDIPVLAAAQLNRQLENREDKRPKLSDFRESGSLEQDADVAMFLHRPEMFEPGKTPGAAEIIVAKNRHGEPGIIDVDWNAQITKFVEIGCRDILPF